MGERLRDLWVVAWHPKDAFHVLQLGNVLKLNRQACIRKNQEALAVLTLAPTLEDARLKKREIVREVLAARRGEADETGGNDDGRTAAGELDG